MKAIKLSEKKLEAVIDSYLGLIGSIENGKVKSPLLILVDTLAEKIFSAPASNKLEYHNCFVGGLAEHS